MCVFGRIVKVDKKSTLLWNNGKYYNLNFVSSHSIGDIVDKNDNLITECHIRYNHEKDKREFEIFKRRFLYLRRIRQFFDNLGFLEVSTPKLKKSILNETNISAMKTPYGYLTPSPETEIKKLISLGFDKVFELCFAYRNDFQNSLHKKEFLILEWYRAMEKPQKIVDDFLGLIKYLNNSDTLLYRDLAINLNRIDYITYKELFLKYADINIDDFSPTKIKKNFNIEGEVDRLEVLDAVFGLKIEKNLGMNNPVVVYNFPAPRAALSKIEKGYAQRYELYIAGIELSNCYNEENSYAVIKKRFENRDKKFFEAMKKGIPSASGIAVGVDRVIMLLLNLSEI